MFTIKCFLMFACLFGFMQTWNTHYRSSLFSFSGNFVVILSYMVLFVLFGMLFSAFKIGIYRVNEIIYSLSLVLVFTNMIMYVELCLVAREIVSPLPLISSFIYQLFACLVLSFCANTIYFKLYVAREMLAVFSDDEEGIKLLSKMSSLSERFHIARGCNINTESVENIKSAIDGCEAVIICDIDKAKQKELILYCYTNNKRVYLLPDAADIIIKNSYPIQIDDIQVLLNRNRGLSPEQAAIKRFFDILLSALALIVLSPFMLMCAVAIKLDDHGPVFFLQERITQDGKHFKIYKFRSMVCNADKDGAIKARNDDDRITRIGKIIRACRFDEVPQFINVLKGDMSVVGPRPERIENVAEYTAKYPEFVLRHKVKAGLTGYAQLYGKYNTTPYDKLNMDLSYIESYSLFLDLKLMLLTVKVLFMKESTEGFSLQDSITPPIVEEDIN